MDFLGATTPTVATTLVEILDKTESLQMTLLGGRPGQVLTAMDTESSTTSSSNKRKRESSTLPELRRGGGGGGGGSLLRPQR